MTLPTQLTTEALYARYRLPQLLQTHLWRTASLMELLLQAWRGPALNHQLLIETMLLHDLGNLVKFDFSDTAPVQLLSPSELSEYKALQAEWHATYGTVADQVTVQFINELKLANGPAIRELILTHTNGTQATTVTQTDWNQKLCDYTDFRVAPYGIASLQERFVDLGKRYAGRAADWNTAEKVTKKLKLFTTLETQLQDHIDRDLSLITDKDLEPLTRWKTYRFAILPE